MQIPTWISSNDVINIHIQTHAHAALSRFTRLELFSPFRLFWIWRTQWPLTKARSGPWSEDTFP